MFLAIFYLFFYVSIQPWSLEIASCQPFHPDNAVMFLVKFIKGTFTVAWMNDYT